MDHLPATEPGPTCAPGKFRCNDGTCIEESYHCDDVTDCRDGSDEQNCGSRTDGNGMYKAVLLLTGKCLARCCILDLLTRAFWFKFTMGNHGEWMDGWMNELMN
jgi:hypothetical protein